jgi:crotonobetainyl-CoA:carnitine CoA-transferase CaiB-like acyl-CoA transferase
MRESVGFAQTVEQFSGMCWRTGYADGAPMNPSGPADPMGGGHAVAALLGALRTRMRTGTGMLVESALVEAALTMTSELALEWSANSRLLSRDGNRDRDFAPHGVYRCQGVDSWVAIAVQTTEQWNALITATGLVGWLNEPKLAEPEVRLAQADTLDAELGAWTLQHSADEVVDLLQAMNIPAARVTDPRVVHLHPQIQGRRILEEVTHPVGGKLQLFSLPFKSSLAGRWSRRPAPLVGEHNGEVLGGELGRDAAQLAALQDQGVIGIRPSGL